MKRSLFWAAGAVAAALSLSAAPDVLSDIGVSPERARQNLVAWLSHDAVSVPEVRTKLKAATPAVRAQLVDAGLRWAKAYTATPEFAKAYAAAREKTKPAKPDTINLDAQAKEELAELKDYLRTLDQDLKDADAADKASIREVIQETKDRIAELQGSEYREEVKSATASGTAAYAEELRKWNERYPADPKAVIRQRLAAFMKVSADVDFDAKLVASGRKMRFANAAYESKPPDWKLCYRAGKEATTAARTVAAAWLKELGG
ncbi:MAG TPA: hypothetical protein VF618_01730 [Thermoanaerobaculia bacterium]